MAHMRIRSERTTAEHPLRPCELMEVSQKGGTLGTPGMYRDYMGIMGVFIRDCTVIILRNTLIASTMHITTETLSQVAQAKNTACLITAVATL